MRTTAALAWKPSATLPKSRTSFAGIGYAEMVERARNLAPQIAARAEECERLRRLPDSTERDLHDSGLFRMVQPARVGGADLDIGILVDTCAEVARVCPSTAWNLGNLASHHWMLGYFPPEAQDRVGVLLRKEGIKRDPEVQALVGRVTDRRIVTFGFNAQADVRAVNLTFEGGRAHFDADTSCAGAAGAWPDRWLAGCAALAGPVRRGWRIAGKPVGRWIGLARLGPSRDGQRRRDEGVAVARQYCARPEVRTRNRCGTGIGLVPETDQ